MSATSAQRALLNLMLLTSTADSRLRDSELSIIDQLIRTLPVFIGIEHADLTRASSDLATLLADDDGVDQVVAAIVALPMSLRETAYALAVEVIAADGLASQEELQLLETLADATEIDPLMRTAIEASARVRRRKA